MLEQLKQEIYDEINDEICKNVMRKCSLKLLAFVRYIC